MTRLSEIEGRSVLASDEARLVGRVAGVVIDPRKAVVVALRVHRAPSGDTLDWPDISGLGADAVMVGSSAAIHEPTGRAAEIREGDHEFVGKRLLTHAGDELGRVTDVAFDEKTGTVTDVYTSDGPVPGDALLGCGSYAVVVQGR
ncbi:MAG: PRC-barrel domain-containing protein [Actinomycetota bacterium]|nr:PRC-barrel domain-containing protein [Actinomycetota bacterium]